MGAFLLRRVSGGDGPAVVLVVIVVCANLLGDGIAEALRPTGRR